MQLANQNINNRVVQNAIHTYMAFENALTKETCQQIIKLGKSKWIQGKIQYDMQSKVKLHKKTRDSDVAWCDDDWLYEICWSYLNTANVNGNWNFKISSCEPMQITRYKKNGHYNFHFDGNGFTRYNMPEDQELHGKTRKLSMSIILNENYEGGEFEFFDGGVDRNTLIKEKTGTVIVFPSYFVHRVRPVTKGTRYSLVAWFTGEPFV